LNIGQRIAIQKDEIGCFACFNRAEPRFFAVERGHV
jgi:hypothetical protein